jgi:hypothetical protein
MKRGLIVVALISLFAGEALATPFYVCMKRLAMRSGGTCTACKLVDTGGMSISADDACKGLPSRMFHNEIDARKFMNRECDCR